jgi:hypothetical protein
MPTFVPQLFSQADDVTLSGVVYEDTNVNGAYDSADTYIDTTVMLYEGQMHVGELRYVFACASDRAQSRRSHSLRAHRPHQQMARIRSADSKVRYALLSLVAVSVRSLQTFSAKSRRYSSLTRSFTSIRPRACRVVLLNARVDVSRV